MKPSPLSALTAVCILFLVSLSVFGHHKIADFYDTTKPIALKGVVTHFIRANPHSFILIDVKNAKGETQGWAVEGDAPNTLVGYGWELRSTVKQGDAIGITAFPAKLGAKPDPLVLDDARMPPDLQALLKKVGERQAAQRGSREAAAARG